MTTASHYVIKDILNARKTDEFGELFKKFAERYSRDSSFIKIYSQFSEDGDIKKASGRLEDLAKVRRLEESGGGTNLPFKDRRHFD